MILMWHLKNQKMEINILVFGQLEDITGETKFKMSDVKNTDELNQKLAELFLKLPAIKYALAINKKIVHENTLLNDGDTVALLPAFSGG